MSAESFGSWDTIEWSISSFSASCAECETAFEEGDVVISALTSVKTGTTEEESENNPETQVTERETANSDSKREEERPDTTENDSGQNLSFVRLDYCESCWENGETEPFSFWMTRVPEPEEEDSGPDRSTLAGVWRGLLQAREETSSEDSGGEDGELEPEQTHELLYLLTLMLMRKGFLSLEEEKNTEDARKLLRVRVRGTDDQMYNIPELEIKDDELDRIKTELAELLDMDQDTYDEADGEN